MELKVWVEGIQRVVCGVCERTTCQDIVYALAHATGKTGRFTLIERWRNNERLLAPHEHPLKVLMKWGEYSSDVHFILQRTALNDSPGKNGGAASVVSPPSNNNKNASSRPTKTSVDPLHGFTPPPSSNNPNPSSVSTPPSAKDIKKSLTFSGGRPAVTDSPQPTPTTGGGGERRLNVGVVRGVPQQSHHQVEADPRESGTPTGRQQNGLDKSIHSVSNPPQVPPTPPQYQLTHQPVVDGGHLVYPRYDPPYGRVVRQSAGPINGSGCGMDGMETPPPLAPMQQHSPAQYNSALARDTPPPPGRGISGSQSPMEQNDPVRFPPPYRNPPPPSFSPGSRQPPPPPYREPPRPSKAGGLSPGYRASPTPSPGRSGTVTGSASSSSSSNTPLRPSPGRQPGAGGASTEEPSPSDDAHHRRSSSRRNLKLDLVQGSGGGVVGRAPSPPSDPVHAQLIQRVNRQRGALDEQQDRLSYLERELLTWEERLNRRLDEERQRLTSELIQLEECCRQQENQLKDLVGVEEEWEQVCREGREMTDELARLRADVSSMETRIDQCEPTLRSLRIDIGAAEERLTGQLEAELSRVKADLEAASQEERGLAGDIDKVDEEVAESEGRLDGIRAQIESLTQEIKQANLQSLSIAPADDLKLLLEGSGHKSGGHARRMLGSPRQLENPVPTNKNPHGVWV